MKPFHLNKANHCHIQGEETRRLTRYYFICGFRFITKKLTGTIFKWNISFLSNRNSFLSMRLKFSYLIKNCIWSNQIKINPILLLFNLNEIFSRLTLNNNSRMPDKQTNKKYIFNESTFLLSNHFPSSSWTSTLVPFCKHRILLEIAVDSCRLRFILIRKNLLQ